MAKLFLEVMPPIIGLIVNVLAQVVVFRFIPRIGLLKSVFSGFAAGLLTLISLELYIFFSSTMIRDDYLFIIIANFIIYAVLGYCYFHFINLGETARRIRILRELHDSKEGLSMGEILERYDAKKIVEMRMNRLVKNRQIIYRNGRYYIGNSFMLLVARILEKLKLMVLGEGVPSE